MQRRDSHNLRHVENKDPDELDEARKASPGPNRPIPVKPPYAHVLPEPCVLIRESSISHSATPRDQWCGLDKLVSSRLLDHPSRHRIIRDWHPGVQSTRPVHCG